MATFAWSTLHLAQSLAFAAGAYEDVIKLAGVGAGGVAAGDVYGF